MRFTEQFDQVRLDTSGLSFNAETDEVRQWIWADEEKYDKQFPDHPLSRLRRKLPQLEKSVILADSVKQAGPFTFKNR